MADTTNLDDAKVYMNPNIREMSLRTLNERMEQRRNRRLIAAIETNRLKIAKLDGMIEKDKTKFFKLTESAAKRLDQVRDLLDKAEADIREATQLHNHMDLLNQTKGNT